MIRMKTTLRYETYLRCSEKKDEIILKCPSCGMKGRELLPVGDRKVCSRCSLLFIRDREELTVAPIEYFEKVPDHLVEMFQNDPETLGLLNTLFKVTGPRNLI